MSRGRPGAPLRDRAHRVALRRPVVNPACIALILLGAACETTVDSLGYNGPAGTVLHPITGPASYPNAFRDLLGQSDTAIGLKISGAFNQLFHGDTNNQAIYFTVGTNQAYIKDILHGDVRTEGMGYGMMIAVELDKRDEFDRLWSYAKASMQIASGPGQGYFLSSCDTTAGPAPCVDPFGLEQFVTALLFAHDRWGDTTGPVNYGSDVKQLLFIMRHKQDENGGIVAGVTDTFDPAARLPFDLPDISSAGRSRPSLAMPAYYALWAQAVDDPFWSKAAASARAYWQRSADPKTALWPLRAHFDGTPVDGGNTFASEAFRAQLSMALDGIWSGGDPWEVSASDLLVQFFTGEGVDTYGSSYTLDGNTVLDTTHDDALIAANGATALLATVPARVAFVQAVWNSATPSGVPRYFSGLLNLQALLILGGQYRVY